MKRITSVINWVLLFSLPIMLLTVNIKTNTINSNIDTKKLATSLVSNVELEEVAAVENTKKEEKVETEDKEVLVKETKAEDKKQQEQKNIIVEDSVKIEVAKEEKKEETVVEKKSDVLETYNGTMSYYNANCTGCSGITSTGVDVSDGRIYYNDKTYGNVRIVAAGTEIKKWSIIRIKNSSLGTSTLAIVLDRGGSIGVGKKFLIDMLTNSSENKGGIEKNITVEVIRNGK